MRIKRKDIYLLTRNSNLSEKDLETLLKRHVYADETDWKKFFRVFCASLGIGFAAAGVVFFFAYNWAVIHKFVKFGIIEGAIIIVAGLILATKFNLLVKNILLTGLAILVGVMFAVFGQVYQTGANAYDFFLGWTLCITLWVMISNFAPLWLLYLILVNTTFLLYYQQEASGWSNIFAYSCLFYFNAVTVIVAIWISEQKEDGFVSSWFVKLMTLASLCFSILAIILGIFNTHETSWFITLLISVILYGLGIWYGLTSQTGFYIAVIAFSVIIIIASFLIDLLDHEAAGMFLLVSLFVIASVSVVIKVLLNLQKKWSYERE